MKKESSGGPPSQETDERVEKSKRVVLATAYELLTKSGLNGVSVDEVSRRSGVAKTTIYRHWPSREALLSDACAQFKLKPQIPDTGSLKGDLETLAGRVAARLRQPWSAVMLSVIDAAERDKGLAELQAQLLAQAPAAIAAVIERAQQRGEVPHAQDCRELVASILGPLVYRRFFSREPLDQAFAERVVERALRKPG